MSVSITQDLAVSPRKGKLPLAITLTQSLSTNLPQEQAKVIYELAEPSGTIGFDAPGNKTLTKTRTVKQNSRPFNDKTTLRGSWTDGAILVINQTLTDQSGSQLDSSCSVRIGSFD
jgi:hypothetical protein